MFSTPPARKTFSCGQCKAEDSMQMVQCDKCDIWYHFECAGVDATIKDQPWKCSKCNSKTAPLDKMEDHNNERVERATKTISLCSTRSSKHRNIDLELKFLEEEKALEQKYLQKKFEILSAGSEKQFEEKGSCSHVPDRTREWVSKLSFPIASKEEDLVLSNSQLVARQALSRELPIFNGKPEEWPLFYSSFQESTKICGYSSAENLLRLQKCLKGKAYELVSSHLLLPTNVPEIIQTLKMMFGRPCVIINSMLDKIRSEPAPKADKLETLVSYAILVRNLCSTMEASGLDAHMNNPLLLQELVDKLPAQTKLNWAMYIVDRDANISMFSQWLYNVAEAVSQVSSSLLPLKFSSGSLHAHESEKNAVQKRCPICDKQHYVDSCSQFTAMKLNERWDMVKKFNLCRLCLNNHGSFRCSKDKCSVEGCEVRHNKLLHKFARDPTRVSAHSCPNYTMNTYFKILPVTLHHKGTSVDTYAFLDDGSNVTLIEKEVCDKLSIEGQPKALCLKWTSNTSRTENESMQVCVWVSAREENAKKFELLDVRTVDQLALPVQSVTKQQLSSFSHLKKIPYLPYVKAVPKILIGLNNGYVCNTLKTAEGKSTDPCASKTRLGWVVHGGGQTSDSALNIHNFEQCDCDYEMEKLHNIVSEYLSLENFGRRIELEAPDIARAKEVMHSTTKRIGKRFETGLIWKSKFTEFPNSYPMALRRLHCLEKKLSPDHIPVVTKYINDLVTKGYARKLSDEETHNTNGVIWYLPIFTVTNPNKPGKVRLVWDAAAKVRGTSLNSMLLKGPDLTAPLLSVLYGFRMKKVAICGDIKEMFHQVLIRKEDQSAQRFLWRNNEDNRNPDIYVMQVMTFGAACSPCSAQYVKNRNADEFKAKYPRAVDSIINHHYVDDLLDCADTESEAIKLAKDVAFIHSEGGFFIRNFKSNSKVVMENLGELQEQNSISFGNQDIQMSTEKVLGMWWSTATDNFTYSLKLNRLNNELLSGDRKPTKKEVLRTLMSVFDPLGFLSPYVVYLKIILQEVWRTTDGWNDEITDDAFRKWLIWVKLLPTIENTKIPRWYQITVDSSIQLHIFVDASELAYAAVGYFLVNSGGVLQCSLVSAKVKVAPKQPVSIPRMELLAAVLGTRLANIICSMHQITFERRWFWSDSKTVLAWLRADPRNYKQFVMFRIGEILESTKFSEWRYVPTKANVADDATKWKAKFEINMQTRWFTGPEFLKQPEHSWPEKGPDFSQPSEELRPHMLLVHINEASINCIDYHRFSSWGKLLNMVCKLFTFCCKLKHSCVPEKSELLAISENYLYRQIQYDFYKDEIAVLKNKSEDIAKTSIIYKCSPYLDENDVLRMYGRIDLATKVVECVKRPIILPRDHYCTSLLIRHFHIAFHHIHHDTCLNEIRQKFYIPRLRVELKKVRRNCQRCKNNTSTPKVPEMAQMPKARLSPFTRPFTHVGLDYFGPIRVKVARHEEKRWGVLFTCLTVRAVHLEIARDMTTDSCIMAIQNFIARRGTPISIYCDNGTNFRGAETELRKSIKDINFPNIANKFSTSSTKWYFNPPASPHMGGSWERLIQSVKKTLYQITPNFIFKEDTLYNALLECERIINSRPLTYVDLESVTDEALTPNHFILGSSNGNKPLGEFTTDDLSLRKNWRKVQYFANLFWKRWVQEYLPNLTKRTKWHEKSSPIGIDDIVVIVDPNLPRNNWPLGIVETVYKAKDGNVRSATVRTATSTFTRPVAKLAKLDVRKSTT